MAGQISWDTKFKFIVEIDGMANTGFSKCTGLEAKITPILHREGGALVATKTPGLVDFPDITLEKGACKDREIFEWYQDVVDVQANAGLVDFAYKRNLDIVQLDRDNSTRKRWRVSNAFPINFKPGEWDNSQSEIVIVSLTLAYDWFNLVD